MLRRVSPALLSSLLLGLPVLLPAAPGELPREAVTASLRRSGAYLSSIQAPDGTWLGRVESDARITALYLLTARALERVDPVRFAAVERYLASIQHPDGYFEAWPGGGPDLSTTRLTTLALKQSISTMGSEVRLRALSWLETQGEMPPPDLFLMTYGAISGELPWSTVPYISPRIVALPDWFHPNVYDVSFLRVALVPLALLRGHAEDGTPRAAVSAQAARPSDAREPTPGALRKAAAWVASGLKSGLFQGLTRMSTVADRLLPPMNSRRLAREWILARREADGSFGGTFQATSLSLIALHREDPEGFRDVVDQGLEALHGWQVEDERGRWQQFCDSTIWDTATSLRALRRLGVPAEDPRVQAAADFLAGKQCTVRGDWARRAPDLEPGAWAFERHNTWYPDVDDTALVVAALMDADSDGRHREAVRKGIRWILGMQNRDGGWAAWDRDDRGWAKMPQGGGWIVGDPSYLDLTGRVVSALAPLAYGGRSGYEDLREPVRAALRRAYRFFLENRSGPAWFGWWFTHYVHGTGEVLEAMHASGVRPDHPAVQAALAWLRVVQNPDGGFGESPRTGAEKHFVAMESTVHQSAYGLKALVSAGQATSPEAVRAVEWLLAHQEEDGRYEDPAFTGVGIPGLWYSRYTLSPSYTVPLALAAWLEAVNGATPERSTGR